MIIQMLRRTESAAFNRGCAMSALLFLLLSNACALLWQFHQGKFTPRWHRGEFEDCPQYYMAGLIAYTGAWEGTLSDP